ncbi:DsrE/DsrF/DrsH-like family protein [Thermoproteus tenax]|uniref:Peroxiredoxin family protein n=1 Tax=Thermoproteus tenax (strain ATCC 35583 / DSM 2078 / JCM 9277 / NBRC 100435 / Kra 1) TaxID=768679 RepID=G4RP05_THETK|nr:DsrE/DsrF/DrsH-like family protein [Thermoproteus tenax]CCC81299.1 peroxiredoxin family protein [Thermoproteus tenax Kra 1]
MADKISMIVFTGTDDKMIPVGVISQAAAALGYEVYIFFTGWAMFKLLKQPMGEVWPKEFEGMVPKLKEGMARLKAPSWKDMLKQAKSMGAKVYVCSMMAEAAGLKKEDFDPTLVDDVVGVTTFLEQAKGGQVLFI